MMKANHISAADRLNDLIDQIVKIHKNDQLNKTEVEGKKTLYAKTMPQTCHAQDKSMQIHTQKNMDVLRQNDNGISDKHECNIKTNNEEAVATTRYGKRIRKPDRLCYNKATKTFI